VSTTNKNITTEIARYEELGRRENITAKQAFEVTGYCIEVENRSYFERHEQIRYHLWKAFANQLGVSTRNRPTLQRAISSGVCLNKKSLRWFRTYVGYLQKKRQAQQTQTEEEEEREVGQRNYKLYLVTLLAEGRVEEFNGEHCRFVDSYKHFAADLQGIDLRHAKLAKVILAKMNLSKANFTRTWLEGADFGHANLSGADFSGAFLSNANFEEAKLCQTDFSGASLCGANLSKANLNGANFGKAHLGGTKFYQALLKGATFEGANLMHANLWRAYDLSPTATESFIAQFRQSLQKASSWMYER
jgi:uncharacterized protein YjbI with pentapeptide repeats